MVENVRGRIQELQLSHVSLDVLRTSDRSDSDSYIKRKRKVLESAGIEFRVHDVGGQTRKELMNLIGEMNSDQKVHGILVQFPLGDQLKRQVRCEELMDIVDWRKDVDGFNPVNVIHSISKGKISSNYYESCTPKAVMRLFKEMEIDLKGVDIVLIGKSRVVGLPLLHQLLSEGATVQTCHKGSHNLRQKCREAEILIVAAGSAHLVKEDFIRPGAIVIDIGVNYDAEGRLIGGDVDYENGKKIAGYITPVPGGIGPLTIAALAENVLKAAILNQNNK